MSCRAMSLPAKLTGSAGWSTPSPRITNSAAEAQSMQNSTFDRRCGSPERGLLRDRQSRHPGSARRSRARRRARSRSRRGGRQGGVSGLGRQAGRRAGGAAAQARRSDRETRSGHRRHRNAGYRPGDRADRQAIGSALRRQFPLLRRNVRARGRPHLSHGDAPELHAVPPRGRVCVDLALECAVHDRDMESCAGARLRQHRRAQDERAVAAVGRAARRTGVGGGNSRGGSQYRAWAGSRGG